MRVRSLAVAASAIVFFAACSSFRPANSTPTPVNGRLITEEMIAQSNATTAWEVIEQTGAYRMISDPAGSRSGVHSHRGRTSILLIGSDVPRLIIDGARVSDLGRLHDIPAQSIAWIELLGGIAGAAEEGTNSGGGVIRIVSKAGR
jgi:hypothetical protein